MSSEVSRTTDETIVTTIDDAKDRGDDWVISYRGNLSLSVRADELRAARVTPRVGDGISVQLAANDIVGIEINGARVRRTAPSVPASRLVTWSAAGRTRSRSRHSIPCGTATTC